jgi:UDP-glucose 4-epimerase
MDLAEAHISSLQLLEDGGGSREINLGTGTGHSVMEIIREVQRISSVNFPVLFEDRRPGDPPVLVAESGKAQQLLGWQATRSGLDTIIATAWNWHRRRHGRIVP